MRMDNYCEMPGNKNLNSGIKRRLLGVVGGMGMQATNYFCRLITEMQNVKAEQDYLNMLVYYNPSIPDRTAYLIQKSSENPLPALCEAVAKLENAGATYIAIPCVTSHNFYEYLTNATDIPIINMLEKAAGYVSSIKLKKVGLLATTGTVKTKVFESALNEAGVETVVPSEEDQNALMDIIYKVKQGKSIGSHGFNELVMKLQADGAQAIVLGCTELSLIADERDCFVDSLKVLARASLNYEL